MPTNLRQFQLELHRVAGKVPENRVVEFTKKVALEALARVVKRTPVDTGRARGNWQLAIGRPGGQTFDVTSESGAMARARSAIAELPPFSVVYLSNHLPYIERLENGYSKQSPAGMVAVTVAEINSAFRGQA